MKRATFVLLLIIMVITMFAGCEKAPKTEFEKEVNQIERGMNKSEVKDILGEPTAIRNCSIDLTFMLYEYRGEGVFITIKYDEEFDIKLPEGKVIKGIPGVTEITYRNNEEWKEYSDSEAGQRFLADFTYNEAEAAKRATEFEKLFNQIEYDMPKNEVKDIMGEPTAVWDQGDGMVWIYESTDGEGATFFMALIDDTYIATRTNYYNSINWTEFKESDYNKELFENLTYTN